VPSVIPQDTEPIAGYVIRERLGAGGYGEVWKADAPGGLQKAVKVIYGYSDDERASRELKSLNLIKTLRHPFLLSLERIEVVNGKLIIVTELAEGSLKDRFGECIKERQVGVPREELLRYIADAADALDYMYERHGLQHLDVKPENLLLVGGHVKVADFGLVKDVEDQSMSLMGGLTPIYAAPEVYNASPGRGSDQYSLAIVFQEMLTGALPFPGKTPAQLAAQHLNSKPSLVALPEVFRPIVARALSKRPDQRFPSCRELVETLREAAKQADGKAPESAGRAAPVNPDRAQCTTDFVRNSSLGAYVDKGLTEPGQVAINNTNVWSETTKCPSIKITDVPPPLLPESLSAPPTVLIGVGFTGGIILQQIRQRLLTRLKPGEGCPAVQFLLLDSNLNDVMRAQRGDDGAPLAQDDCATLALRMPQDYRAERESHLQWLSRRWIYNIPKSLQTEGMRPLGRLAFVDHHKTVHAKLRQRIARALLPETLAQSSQSIGVQFAGKPRAIVLGSVSGGAGGMLLDVANLTRQLMDEAGIADHDVMGVMVHATGRNPQRSELARVNACAMLRELYAQSRPGSYYPGDPACGLHPRQDDVAPFRHNYFLHLGNDLSDLEMNAALERVAEYLYRELIGSAGSALRGDRSKSAKHNDRGDLLLRSFGVAPMGFDESGVVSRAVERTLVGLVDHWVGDDQPHQAEVIARVKQATKNLTEELRLDFEPLFARADQAVHSALGCPLFDTLKVAVAGESKAPDPKALAALEPIAIYQMMNAIMGPREWVKPDDKRFTALRKKLLQDIEKESRAAVNLLRQWVTAQLEEPSLRLIRAETAFKQVGAACAAVTDAAKALLAAKSADLDVIENHYQMVPVEATKQRTAPPRRQAAEWVRHIEKYCQLRTDELAAIFTVELAAAVKRLITATGDQVVELRRELRLFRSLFFAPSEENEPVEAAPSTCLRDQLEQFLESAARGFRPEVLNHMAALFDAGRKSANESFTTVIMRSGEGRQHLVTYLRDRARDLTLGMFSQIDLAELVWRLGAATANTAEDSLPDGLTKVLADGHPKILAQASRRLIVSLPRQSAIAKDAQRFNDGLTNAGVTGGALLAPDLDNSIAFCWEFSDMPLAHVAWRIVDGRADLVEFTDQVQTRIDIQIPSFASLQ
jgi:serine/threonine protein kinase